MLYDLYRTIQTFRFAIVVFIKTWKNAPENNTQDSPHNQAYDLPGLHMMMTRDAFNTG